MSLNGTGGYGKNTVLESIQQMFDGCLCLNNNQDFVDEMNTGAPVLVASDVSKVSL
jgi:hypothetical protein